MLFNIMLIFIGFAGLIWGGDRFVVGASSLAKIFGISPLIIGLTVVAFGTSAPEIFSSAVAALNQQPDLAIGNTLGSNLFNIGIVLGLTILIVPIKTPPVLLKQELPFLLFVTVITGALFFDLYLGVLDAVFLCLIILLTSFKIFRQKKDSYLITSNPSFSGGEVFFACGYILLGITLLIVGAKIVVAAATSIANAAGVPDVIVGLTVIAWGTSLPELATSLSCIRKGKYEIALGNVVGSNVLNILAVLPFPGVLSPSTIESTVLYRDYMLMLFVTLLLSGFCYYGVYANKKIGRLAGATFVLTYLGWFMLVLHEL
ncbi:MAG: calcium/sodium antiporter [Gammaproteobacteria bacterium]|nr:calcium/sodium antiporter [Gammaproteobacteria bacterium]